ncbi:DUF1572 family protein [Pinibacter aurantiacus]|uniref:DUF1572 domain-containing protein n=1 Tax=Pinibacter aurantiacus TaxID=2851599 RepID=A0A9E2S769_9BACT|nr:DUF1572 family protein [Pinibacter aurantiacus]MBV4356877.1 DUF1572 domain-containing protein [Pinibacter aurantiacus]
MSQNLLTQNAIKHFTTYKGLADKTFAQLSEEQMHYQPNDACNNIAILIQHMSGNMLSRWTNFLTEDGEKPWRNRDTEFNDQQLNKQQLLDIWEKGWKVLFDTLQSLKEEDLSKDIFIRTEPQSVTDAIVRQIAHYCGHVGQIVMLGKIMKAGDWQPLSIAKGQSDAFNKLMQNKFGN